MKTIKVGIAQINPTVGDLKGNLAKILSSARSLAKTSDLIIFPFLSLTGYPLKCLAMRKDFLLDCQKALEELLFSTRGFNFPLLLSHLEGEEAPHLCLLLLGQGRILRKSQRPPSEKRDLSLTLKINGLNLGVSLEEENLVPPSPGLHLWIILSQRSYCFTERNKIPLYLQKLAKESRAFILYVRMASAQDEYIFPGASLALTPEGKLFYQAKAFAEELSMVSIPPEEGFPFIPMPKEEDFSELYQALSFALRDYAVKNHFSGVIVGLSGGIDSALVACLAVSALGKERVKAVFLPSAFTSKESKEDATRLAHNLGINLIELSIQEIFAQYRDFFKRTLTIEDFTVADENLQARIRSNLLFYLSNRENLLVLSTSNKSESATGYGTIYGDMAGGYAPLKDVYKTWVYQLARFRNTIEPVIPERIFTKAPSAELHPGQKDEDTLPPYSYLDAILKGHLEDGLSPSELIAQGFPEEYVLRTMRMLSRAEYKRRQAPIGPKISKTTLGIDYVLPITNLYLP